MIIHAASIHSGGGKVLLDQLLQKKEFGRVSLLICDTRYIIPKDVDSDLKIIKVLPTLKERWKAEIKLKKYTDLNPNQTVLCFSNLPPAFKLNAKVILYLQNALLLPGVKFYTTTLWAFFRLCYEKIWLNFFWKNLDEVWVQTNWMKKSLIKLGKPIIIRPIFPILPTHLPDTSKKYDFISVSGGAPHKRQNRLLEAWSKMPTPPSLLLITDYIDKEFEPNPNSNITVLKNIDRDQIIESYLSSHCLIITSKIESFCLPLYEAQHFKLDIISPDEEYATESVESVAKINPDNLNNIISEVMNYMTARKK